MKGILLISYGHWIYGNMAYNLANCLKSNAPNLQIALATDKRATESLTCEKFGVFDRVIENNLANKSKVSMYDLTPFKETIFLDVDSMLFEGQNPFNWIENDIDFEGQNFGIFDVNEKVKSNYTFWTDLINIKKQYPEIKELPQFSSCFMYFKKSKKIKKFFEAAKKVFETPKTDYVIWNNTIPDEYCFNIASGLTGILPSAGFSPLAFSMNAGGKIESDIRANFKGITMTTRNSTIFLSLYNRLMRKYTQGSGSKFLEKSNFLDSRRNF